MVNIKEIFEANSTRIKRDNYPFTDDYETVLYIPEALIATKIYLQKKRQELINFNKSSIEAILKNPDGAKENSLKWKVNDASNAIQFLTNLLETEFATIPPLEPKTGQDAVKLH